MRHTIRAAFLIAMASFAAEAVDIRHVSFDALERLDEYQTELENLLRYEPWLGIWIADEYWDAPVSKQALLARVRRVYDLLNRFPEPENQEFLLLRAILSEYRYHLSDRDAFEQTVEHYLAIERLPDRDYRNRWFLGLFYTFAARPFESIEQFRWVDARVPEEQLHPAFFGDYALAALLANMEATARLQFERMFRVGGYGAADDQLYRELESRRIDPTPESTLDTGQVYRLLERSSGLGLFSGPLGLWLPVEPHWRMRSIGFSNGVSLTAFSPPAAVTGSGESIGYTIMTMTYVDPTRIERDWLTRFPDRTRFDSAQLDRIRLYEYRDPNLYAHMGGARGLLGIARSAVPGRPTVGIEEPGRIPELVGDGAYRLGGDYSRIPVELSHVFFLDASDVIFDEASAVFLAFLEGVRIE